MQVPNKDTDESPEWFLRERIKELEAEVAKLTSSLQQATRERDHWFNMSQTLGKIALNQSEHLA